MSSSAEASSYRLGAAVAGDTCAQGGQEMRLRYGALRARHNRAEHDDSVGNAHLEAIQVRADEPELPELSDDDDFLYDDDDFVYDAFISYTRGNLDVANKIERGLESFLLPREIRKRVGRRCLNVFLDVSDLTGNRLDPALEHNLERSRTLVVLCSPAARRSRYVSTEINRFAQLRDAEKIIPVLIAGGPNNDPTVDAAEWAFPDALSEVLGSDPLAADLRRAWSIEDRKARLAQGSPWVQLIGSILDATTDDLTERLAKAQRYRLLKNVGFAAALLAAGAGGHYG
jgi:hypothetical protein